MSDAVYIVEFRSIANGIGALDTMLKRASLLLLHADPICIGKYLICVGGDVADAGQAKLAAEAEGPMASCLLTGAHPAILAYFRAGVPPVAEAPDGIAIIETRSAAAGFLSLDAALKGARVCLLRLWLGQLIGGKLCYVLGGAVSDVESAARAAARAIAEKELAGSRVIPSPDAATMARFVK